MKKKLVEKVVKLGIGFAFADRLCKITKIDRIIAKQLDDMIRVHDEEQAMSKFKFLCWC